jgi:hypothetical protein
MARPGGSNSVPAVKRVQQHTSSLDSTKCLISAQTGHRWPRHLMSGNATNQDLARRCKRRSLVGSGFINIYDEHEFISARWPR